MLHPLRMDLNSGFVFYPENEDTMFVSGRGGPPKTVDPDAYQTRIDLD